MFALPVLVAVGRPEVVPSPVLGRLSPLWLELGVVFVAVRLLLALPWVRLCTVVVRAVPLMTLYVVVVLWPLPVLAKPAKGLETPIP